MLRGCERCQDLTVAKQIISSAEGLSHVIDRAAATLANNVLSQATISENAINQPSDEVSE